MEDLNKNQIILLTLLVSFVTSIATGIMTVSLLQQAPIEVTRNINRVVEKTIEKVTPADILGPKNTEVTTVVVKEEDLVIDAINKNVKSIVRIKERDGLGETTFYGMGLVVSKDGLVIADRQTIHTDSAYFVVIDGVDVYINPVGVDKKTDFLLFKAAPAKDKKFDFVPATFAGVDPKLGQSVVALGGDASNAVAVGRVISFSMRESGTGSTTVKYVSGIDTDIVSRDLVAGSPIFTLAGDIVGMHTSGGSGKIFTSSQLLKKDLATLSELIK